LKSAGVLRGTVVLEGTIVLEGTVVLKSAIVLEMTVVLKRAVVVSQRFKALNIILGSASTAAIQKPAGSSKGKEYEDRQNRDEVVEQSHGSRDAELRLRR